MPVGHRMADWRDRPAAGIAAYLDGIWGFYLRPAPGGQTRLVARTRGRSRPQPLMGAVGLVLFQPVHFIMQTRQFRNLRARVSAQAPGLS